MCGWWPSVRSLSLPPPPPPPPTTISPHKQITESAEETATYVTELTRSLAETPYRDANAEFNIMFNKCVRELGYVSFRGRTEILMG